ncbi:MAG: histidine kinase [Eubacteriales bacterium]|nr:histidine kinase [Eubacteriales bacterium]
MKKKGFQAKKPTSIQWKMVSIMLLYWVIPFILMIAGVGHYLVKRQEKAVLERMAGQLELDDQISIERLDSAISDSRQATYDRTLYGYYNELRREQTSFSEAFNKGQYYMTRQFGKRKEISDSIFMIKSNPENLKITTYNTPAGGSYRHLETYWEKDHEAVMELAETLDTSIGLYYREGRLYLVRNLVNAAFEPWGILVHRLNMNYCLEPLLKSTEEGYIKVKIGDHTVVSQGDQMAWDELPLFDSTKDAAWMVEGGWAYIYQTVKGSDFTLSTVLRVDTGELFTPLYDYQYLILIMIAFLVPMILIFLMLARKYLIRPLNIMVEHAREIENGNLGCQLHENTRSLEFESLRDSFNHMSKTLKYQFDHIYEEELALRDAKIMALQSHINPHFMNNTLEIINWEARLGGNEKVSKMIEALSTLMDAAMDRRKLPEVPFSEEMIYVNAYLYIASERLGKRLKVVKELDESTMQCLVPRLILQPIIENAVEHGVVPRGEGTVTLRSFFIDHFLVLEIENDGEMTGENQERIKRLLSPDYDTSKESSGNLGIANVNQRLRILYGEDCGLFISCEGENKVVSRLLIGNVQTEQENARNRSSSYSNSSKNTAYYNYKVETPVRENGKE